MTSWKELSASPGNDPALAELSLEHARAIIDVLALVIHADRTLAGADWELHPLETQALRRLAESLAIDEGRARSILSEVSKGR